MRFILEGGPREEFTFAQIRGWLRDLYTGQKGKKKIPEGRRVANHTNVNIQRYMRYEVEDI